MATLALVALGLVMLLGPTASAAGAAGKLLWSDTSLFGPGVFFDSATACANGDVIIIMGNQSYTPTAIKRLQPDGTAAWSKSLPSTLVYGFDTDCSIYLGPSYASTSKTETESAAPDIGVVFCNDDNSGSLLAFDPSTGRTLWDSGSLPCGDLPQVTVSAGWFGCAGGNGQDARALAISIPNGKLLFNLTLEKAKRSGCDGYSSKSACLKAGCGWDSEDPSDPACTQTDWFSSNAGVTGATTQAGVELALVGTVEGSGFAPGSLFAIGVVDGSLAWKAAGITAEAVLVVGDVVVASADTRGSNGEDSKIAELRGYSLANGTMLWQRTKKSPDDARGVPLGRACDADCRLPCSLVEAGIFGAIDVSTGATVFNVSASSSSRIAMADGIAYSIHFPKAAASDASDVSVPRAAATSSPPPTPSVGRLVASSCAALGGNGDDVSVGDSVELGATAAASVLWSVPLPTVSDGQGFGVWQRGVIVTPTSPSLHRSVRGAALSTTAGVPVVVYAGGHVQGSCVRGHCEPSYSAVAAFQAPPGIIPPPVPPPPPPPGPAPGPSTCEAKMMSTCAAARKQSVDMCEVCCGEHHVKLFLAGCNAASFVQFCHTSTCRPGQQPPKLCPDGSTCPDCGEPECNCPPPHH